MRITAEQFHNATGRYPKNDDLDRCNCDRVGEIGHYFCGWCEVCDKPRFLCAHWVGQHEPD
jgi:hypothetical protein